MAQGSGRKTRTTGTFGSVDARATGYRARYYHQGQRYQAPTLFRTKAQARAWLSTVQADIIRRTWKAPAPDGGITLADYADEWLPARLVAGRPLKPRTREHYRKLLDDHVLPTLGDRPVSAITAADVRQWHAMTLVERPTMRAHAYSLLRTILASAVDEESITVNPCNIRGAGAVKRAKQIKLITVEQLAVLVENMPERFRLLVLLASWTSLRFGELTELRRADVDLVGEVIRVRRGVTQTKGDGFIVGDPKSTAGVRDVTVPPHLLDVLQHHLDVFTGTGSDSLLFPSETDPHRHLRQSTFARWFYKARTEAGREDVALHELRHFGATSSAVVGATIGELMSRLGHSTPQAAMRYQHAAQSRDREIAQLLSKLANG